jgi:hypothetical protein
MKKRVVVEHGDTLKIAKALGCSRQMVIMSLRYKKNSILAGKIRYVAVSQFGGVEVGE